jgi:hypothetical protein
VNTPNALTQLLDLLAGLLRDTLPTEMTMFTLEHAASGVCFRLEARRQMETNPPPAPPPPPAPETPPAPAKPARLGPGEKGILEAVSAVPAKAETLAKRCGRPCNSYFRSLLTRLVRLGKLLRTADGFRLPAADVNKNSTAFRPLHDSRNCRDILAACNGVPQTAEAIAARLGRPCSEPFAALVAALAEDGDLVKTPEGYRKP